MSDTEPFASASLSPEAASLASAKPKRGRKPAPRPTESNSGSVSTENAELPPRKPAGRKKGSTKKSTGDSASGESAPAEYSVSESSQRPQDDVSRDSRTKPVEQNQLSFEEKKAAASAPVVPRIELPREIPETYSSDADADYHREYNQRDTNENVGNPSLDAPASSHAEERADFAPSGQNSPRSSDSGDTTPGESSVKNTGPNQVQGAGRDEHANPGGKPAYPQPKPYYNKGGDYKKDFPKKPFKPAKYGGKPQYQGGGYDQGHGGGYNKGGYGGGYNQPPVASPKAGYKAYDKPLPSKKSAKFGKSDGGDDTIQVGNLPEFETFQDYTALCEEAQAASGGGDPVNLNQIIALGLPDLITEARSHGVQWDGAPSRQFIFEELAYQLYDSQRPLMIEGVLELHEDGYGIIVYTQDNYKIRPLSTFLAEQLIRRFGLKRGHVIRAQVHPPREGETTPFVIKIESVMGREPESIREITPFEELVPYYPTVRMLLETTPDVKWDNFSMRIVDLLTPIGRGQRGLIVAPPRTGKTVLQQGIANAIVANNPDIHLIVLLVDERPEEVTDFRRQITRGEVIASTFDQNAESHVHCAEMVIEKARRLVEAGQHVCILLDSITRLARAYNTLAANSGKILSGGVEASALQKPKRFFGSARNIEGAGSLTIIGTALVETGSRMDEVIFEEFKGTGNSELHLDRGLSDKRIFPAIAMERSGTRKEELLYHPDEMLKIYALRRAMKGVPPVDAMEMLITRVRKTRSNAEFLMGLNR